MTRPLAVLALVLAMLLPLGVASCGKKAEARSQASAERSPDPPAATSDQERERP